MTTTSPSRSGTATTRTRSAATRSRPTCRAHTTRRSWWATTATPMRWDRLTSTRSRSATARPMGQWADEEADCWGPRGSRHRSGHCAGSPGRSFRLGCETIHWGFLGSQLRTVCDGPVQPDGSWMRYRVVWVPAHHVPYSTYCGTYSCSSSGGYSVGQTVVAKEIYVVFPTNVLPDEPGWLPPNKDTLR